VFVGCLFLLYCFYMFCIVCFSSLMSFPCLCWF
jgi:hypothetical protein